MDGQVSVGHDGALLVDGLTDDVHDSSQSGGADWHHDRVSSVIDLLSSDESFSRVEGNSSDVVASQMLGDFQNKFVLDALDLQGVENGWKVALELHVHDRAHNLCNFADVVFCHRFAPLPCGVSVVRALPRPKWFRSVLW